MGFLLKNEPATCLSTLFKRELEIFGKFAEKKVLKA